MQIESISASHALLFFSSNTTLTTCYKRILNKSANVKLNEVKAVIKGTFPQGCYIRLCFMLSLKTSLYSWQNLKKKQNKKTFLGKAVSHTHTLNYTITVC